MTTTLTALPEVIDAGTTVRYTRSFADFPASDGWALTLYLAGPSTLSQLAVASGSDFVVTIPAASTAPLLAGTYTWVEQLAKAGEIVNGARGTVIVNANIATAGAGALQSWEEKTLAVVESAIAGQLGDGIGEYQIGTRAVKFIPLEELRKLRIELKATITMKRTGQFSTPIEVNFPPTSGRSW